MQEWNRTDDKDGEYKVENEEVRNTLQGKTIQTQVITPKLHNLYNPWICIFLDNMQL